ncbi:PilT/PilU family type 4a pilus ATPase [archaeon]|nr:MAG: PilT/PilU family type 4a pilus ATPase [archaeon]
METFRQILKAAADSGASDVHLKVGGPVMFRIRRDLVPVEAPIPTATWISSVLQQVVPGPLLQQLEKQKELDLAIEVEGAGRVRANIYQQRGNYVLALRLVKSQIRNFDELHLPDVVRRIAETPRGIVIICGTPGAGKSTTLAAMIHHLNKTVRRHIVTLEDPIEYLFEDQLSVIEQREIGLDTATFATGLHHVLRQDPDVLMIGEMRDAQSVMAAVSAANVGTLVISTLHTADASRAIQRILEFFPSAERDYARRQLAVTLHAVICQKLVRSKDQVIPALEILVNTASVSKLLETDHLEKLPAAIELGTGDGMQTFEQALLRLIESGAITQAEAFTQAPNPEALKMKLQGVILTDSRRILKSRD